MGAGPDRRRFARGNAVEVRWSRDLPSAPSAVTVIRDAAGRYFASFKVAADPAADAARFPAADAEAGIDLGLTSFAVLSDGTVIRSPKFLRRAERKLRRLQKSLCRKAPGSSNRQKARVKVARAHARVADSRRDFHHKVSTAIIRDNQAVYVEDLCVRGLARGRLAKSIHDAGWSAFTGMGNSIGVAVTGVLFFGALGHGYSLAFERSVLQMGALLLVVAALTRLMPGRQETARRRPRPPLRRREHAVQSSDALGGGADVKHDHPGVRLHRPGGPRAALGLHGDEGAQFFLGAALGAEADAQAIRGFGAFGHGPGDELLPALALGRQLGRGEGAGDRSGPRHDVPPDQGNRLLVRFAVKVGLMSNPDTPMTIGAVAALAGKRASSIRYYEQIGLLPPAVRVSGRRVYGADTVRTLAVIETGQRAGLTLDEIKALLSASPDDQAAIERLREVATRKLPQIEALMERSEIVRGWLESAVRCECPSLVQCPLFDDPALLPSRVALTL